MCSSPLNGREASPSQRVELFDESGGKYQPFTATENTGHTAINLPASISLGLHFIAGFKLYTGLLDVDPGMLFLSSARKVNIVAGG